MANSQLFDQLTAVFGISAARERAFNETRTSIENKKLPGGFTGPDTKDSPLLVQLQAEINAEEDIQRQVNDYTLRLKDWALNDPTYASLGINGPPAPEIPKAIGEYFVQVMASLAPGAVVNLAALPVPAAPITIKPGAPAGGNSPWGMI